jgi:CHAT domain-containing protein
VWRHLLQLARLQRSSDRELSAATYQHALNALSAVKGDIPETGHHSYSNLVSPVFHEYAELMLAITTPLRDQQQRNRNLRLIRDTLEQVKTAEIQEYYQDECVVADRLADPEPDIPESAAVIYPILLPNRIEVLVGIGEDMHHFPTNLTTGELTLVVNDYRLEIEEYGAEDDFLPLAQVLYNELIAPAESFIESRNVDTIVFVPDGPLRTVPVSTFHDGDVYLVEKYAIATSPGLSLTSTEESREDETKLLAQGISESVRGFSALPNVDNELKAIQDMYSAQVFQDDLFLLENTEEELSSGDYNVVHIATHGEFDADHSKSYLLAYDDLLSMDRLQGIITNRKYNETPLDLLVLSACKTAAGDDKAALGLAGVALRSGAKSALATLWYISDAATAQVITRFYEELKDPRVSKADALRRAQMVLIDNPVLSHPTDWAPFLLVGNWL